MFASVSNYCYGDGRELVLNKLNNNNNNERNNRVVNKNNNNNDDENSR